MKTIKAAFFLVLLLSVLRINAQSSIKPIEVTIEHDNAQRPCIQVTLELKPKPIKKAWKDYLRDNYDFKLKGIGFLTNKDLLSAKEISVKKISSNEIDFYTQIIDDKNGSEMKVFARHGYDSYISKEKFPNEYMGLRKILESFMKYYLPKYYEDKINETKKRINELTDETNDLKENIVDNSNEIDKLKKEIEELEKTLKSQNELLKTEQIKFVKIKEKLKGIKTQLINLRFN